MKKRVNKRPVTCDDKYCTDLVNKTTPEAAIDWPELNDPANLVDVDYPELLGWNYRVIEHINGDGSKCYGIHEVFYSEGSGLSMTCNDVSPYAETPRGFVKSLELYLQAFSRPIIRYNVTTEDIKETKRHLPKKEVTFTIGKTQ